jgi:hypothetical protein
MDEWLKANILFVTPIASILIFAAGFFTSRLTMTKKERKDVEQKQFENGKALAETQLQRFQEFSTTLKKYIDKTTPPSLDDFYEIATIGEKYFYQQHITADAILAGSVHGTFRDTLVHGIRQTLNKSLPAFYEVLQSIAKKKGFEYHGKLSREDHESLYVVVEKYGKLRSSENFAFAKE